MNLHAQMTGLIVKAATAVAPALSPAVLDADGRINYDVIRQITMPMARAVRSPCGPASAVYVTWDTRGGCRYVGSVRRLEARSAVRERLAEHLRVVERRGRWYAVTVLPMRPHLTLEVVRECEGIVARRLCPAEGSAHPLPSVERSLAQLIKSQHADLIAG